MLHTTLPWKQRSGWLGAVLLVGLAVATFGHLHSQGVDEPLHPQVVPIAAAAARKGRPLPDLNLIHLRRAATRATAAGGEAKRGVDWSGCWVNRAHWRSQPCGSRLSLRRPTYMVPKAVRGNPDKPFRLAACLYSVER